MKLTRAADYGIRAMVHLAGQPTGTRIAITDLAVAADAPESFLSKVMQRLVTSRLVNSHRGATGGFELALPPADVTMLDVITAIEGPVCLNVCLPAGGGCDRRVWCAAHHVWAEAYAKMAEILDGATIERLAAESAQWLALAQANGEYEWP
jgi:Rrf2 family protein